MAIGDYCVRCRAHPWRDRDAGALSSSVRCPPYNGICADAGQWLAICDANAWIAPCVAGKTRDCHQNCNEKIK